MSSDSTPRTTAYLPVVCPTCGTVRLAGCSNCGDEAFLHIPAATPAASEDALREALDQAMEAEMRKAQDIIEREGFVFDDLDYRWQKLAFTLYTMLTPSGHRLAEYEAAILDARLASREGDG